MKGINWYLWIIFWVVFYSSCSSELIPSEMVKYVNNPDNGLVKIKIISPLEATLQYRPIDYVLVNEFRTNQIDSEKYTARKEELAGAQYYKLELTTGSGSDITTHDAESEEEIQERLYYFSYHFEKSMRLVQGRDTLSPVLFHFERSYDLKDERTFVLAFEKKANETEDRTLIFSTPMFSTGLIKITIEAKDIQNVPTLKIN